jgi:hypothetical protein
VVGAPLVSANPSASASRAPGTGGNGVGGVIIVSLPQTASITTTLRPEEVSRPQPAASAAPPVVSLPPDAALPPVAVAPAPVAGSSASLGPVQPIASTTLQQLQPLPTVDNGATVAPSNSEAAALRPLPSAAPAAAEPANSPVGGLASSVALGGLAPGAEVTAPANANAPAADPAVTAIPAVAAPIQPQVDVSGLTLSSVLQLGNLAQQTVQLQARATRVA